MGVKEGDAPDAHVVERDGVSRSTRSVRAGRADVIDVPELQERQ